MLFSSSLLLENFAVPSQSIKNFKFNVEQSEYNYNDNIIKTIQKTYEEIDNIAKTILNSDINNFEEVLDQNIFLFELKYKTIISVILNQSELDRDKLVYLEYNLYDEILKSLHTIENIDEGTLKKILQLIIKFRNYEIIILKTSLQQPDILNEALNKVNFKELRKYVLESTLLLICILAFINDGKKEIEKLFKIIDLLNKKIDIMLTFVDSINILVDKPLQISIQNEIGKILENGFYVNLDKMEEGESYKVNYGITEFQIEKDGKGNLLLNEVL